MHVSARQDPRSIQEADLPTRILRPASHDGCCISTIITVIACTALGSTLLFYLLNRYGASGSLNQNQSLGIGAGTGLAVGAGLAALLTSCCCCPSHLPQPSYGTHRPRTPPPLIPFHPRQHLHMGPHLDVGRPYGSRPDMRQNHGRADVHQQQGNGRQQLSGGRVEMRPQQISGGRPAPSLSGRVALGPHTT